MISAVSAWAQEGPAPLEVDEQKKLIQDVVERARNFTKDLPNYTCVEVWRKNVDPTGTSRHWKITDTIHEQVTEKDGKESFAEMSDNGKQSGSDSRPGGMTSPADFAEVIGWIFDPKSKAVFEWTKWDSLRGHRVHTIAYRVPLEDSPLTVGKKSPIKISFVGTVDVDADTNSIVKVVLLGLGFPKSSPIQSISQEYNFEFAKIGDHYFLLPLKADLQSREGKTLTWNEIEFRDCKKP
jgi:hypothetical protein